MAAKNRHDLNDNRANGIALLSHDLKTALLGVVGSIEQIDISTLDQATAEQLKRARAAGVMLGELLDIASGLAGETENTDACVDVEKEIHLVADVWRLSAKERGVLLILNFGEGIKPLSSNDRAGFHRVLSNLLGNAVKFTAAGEISISVLAVGDSGLRIKVCDSGPGFSEEALETIFQYKGRPSGNSVPGTGLGLYISKTIVEGFGGEISACNRNDGGACIMIDLPTSQSVRPRDIANNGLPDLSHLNILLAEDNITNQLVVTQMLKSMGARYSLASDGVEALEIFDKGEFDLALLDIEMPRKSGLEVMREIRASDSPKSGMPLVALTAYVMHEHRQKIEASGADGVIAKPISGIAELGKDILKHVHGAGFAPVDQPQKTGKNNGDVGDIGWVDVVIFESLTDAIGAEMQGEFIDKVTIDLNNIRNNLLDAQTSDNIDLIRVNSHTLVSVAGAIGAAKLRECSADLNAAAKDGTVEKRQLLSGLCAQGISEVLEFVASRK